MNRKIFTCFYFSLLMALIGCAKSEIEIPQGELSVPVNISNLRKVQLAENLRFGTTSIKGVVVSDVEGKNIDEKFIAVQEEGKDAAILLELKESTNFSFGTEVEIDLSGSQLVNQDDELRITNISSSSIKATGKTVAITPKSTNISSVNLNAKYWGPILVRLENLSLTGGTTGNLQGKVTLNDGVATLNSNFSSGSVFAQEEIPEVVQSYVGIVRIAGDQIYINPGNLNDIQAEAKETIEDFEAASNTNYDVKTLTFKTGAWIVDGGITATSTADLKTGTQSIRLQGTTTNQNRKGILSMGFDLQGVKNLRISHGIYPAAAETSNINPTTFDVQISKDNGATYTSLKQIEVDIKSNVLKTDIVEVKAGKNENVRFRIVNTSTPFANNSRPRINLDDIVFEL